MNSKLKFQPVQEAPELVAPSVLLLLEDLNLVEDVAVAEINPDFADGGILSREYDLPYKAQANCLVVEGKRGEEKTYAALLVHYGKRANTNATVKRPLEVSKVSFAPLDYVIEQTGMEFGSITPVGLPQDWSILIDSKLMDQEELIIGGGLVHSKIQVPTDLLVKLPGAQVIEGLAKD